MNCLCFFFLVSFFMFYLVDYISKCNNKKVENFDLGQYCLVVDRREWPRAFC